MNNSFFAIESQNLAQTNAENIIPYLREREVKLTKLITAIEGLEKSKEWSSLKEELFDGLVERFSKELFSEAKKDIPDQLKLAKLSGKLAIAESYDLSKLKQEYRNELLNIKNQLHGSTTKD